MSHFSSVPMEARLRAQWEQAPHSGTKLDEKSELIEGMTMGTKYTKSQITAIAKHEDENFDELMRHLFDEANDTAFFRYVDALLKKIYILYQENKYLTKTQACRMIPARNASTCIKYVNEAQKRNFIAFSPDKEDKRRLLIHPSDDLINYVEEMMSNKIDAMRNVVSDIGKEQFPEDNMPLAGMRFSSNGNNQIPEYNPKGGS